MKVAILLLVIAMMVALNAMYVAAEFATVGSRRSRVQEDAAAGSASAKRLLAILTDETAMRPIPTMAGTVSAEQLLERFDATAPTQRSSCTSTAAPSGSSPWTTSSLPPVTRTVPSASTAK